MKTLLFSFTMTALLVVPAYSNAGEDTITIDFGNNSKIIILINNQQDLALLQQYDINKMLQDLNLSLDSANEDISCLEIEDKTGVRYLRGTSNNADHADAYQFQFQGYQKEVNVSGFNRINIGHNFEALIRPASGYKVILSGKESDVEDVSAVLNGDRLGFRYNNSVAQRQKVKIYIEMPELTGLKVSGAAKVNAAGFEVQRFRADASGASRLQLVLVANEVRIDASGASKVKAIGKTDEFIANASGAAEINALEFETSFARADASGAAILRINTDRMQSNTSGAGRIFNQKKIMGTVEGHSAHTRNSLRIRIGKYEFSVPTEGWEDFESRFDHVESLADLGDMVEKKKYVQETTPRVRHSVNFELGMNNYLQDGRFPEADGALYSVKPWGSWYVGINSSHKFYLGGPLFLDWGKGINWYNFKFDNPNVRVDRVEQGIGFIEDPRGLPGIRSKITASYLNMGLVPLFDFSKGRRYVKSHTLEGINFTQYNKRGFRVGVGGYAGYRIGSHTKYVFQDNRRQKEKERGNFYLNNWRYGIRGQMGIGGFDMFFNYDLSPLYVGEASPNLQPFSFGVIF
jgi:hypothetical protein